MERDAFCTSLSSVLRGWQCLYAVTHTLERALFKNEDVSGMKVSQHCCFREQTRAEGSRLTNGATQAPSHTDIRKGSLQERRC